MFAFHKASPPYASAFSSDSIHLTILISLESNPTLVEVVFGDPFHLENGQWVKRTKRMIQSGDDGTVGFWSVQIPTTRTRRTKYYFQITASGSVVQTGQTMRFLTERGLIRHSDSDLLEIAFSIPSISRSNVFKVPDWVRRTVWYQIFPERFCNGDPSISPADALEWNPEQDPTKECFYGGDLVGVTDRIDYLADLGVTGIYLTPIFFSRTNHKYDTIDYKKIDPNFGDIDVFKGLVKKAHEKGIKVMLDAVFNHCGLEFFAFKDVQENGRKSRYWDWFFFSEPELETDHGYLTFSFEKYMPKLNTENEEVKEYLLGVSRYWIEECGIDGWRLDVANEVDHDFWREFRRVVKRANPEAFILGEVWHDSMPWLMGDQFDSVMNYPIQIIIREYFALGKMETDRFYKELSIIKHLYPISVSRALFNIIDSHDTTRALTQANGSVKRLQLMMMFQFAYPGTPCVYYGTEIGMEGGFDPLCRACMQWDPEKQNKEMLAFTKELIRVRNEYPAFGGDGYFYFLPEAKANCLAFRKSIGSDPLTPISRGDVLFFLNNSESEADVVQVELPLASEEQLFVGRDIFTRRVSQFSKVTTEDAKDHQVLSWTVAPLGYLAIHIE